MLAGTVCMSHSPLLDRHRPPPQVEQDFNRAVQLAASFAADAKPDLTIVIFPDHLNGFFYDLMPSFCIGLQATSIGDFGTVPGQMGVPERVAADCARFCIAEGVDVAFSYDMRVDHGAAQPLELLASSAIPLIPVFVNCVAPPLPTFARVRALGKAIGSWAARRSERILIVASGGLSHDPPIPQMAGASDQVRTRLISGQPMTHAQRLERQARVIALGSNSAPGAARQRPLNPEWDNKMLSAFTSGQLDVLDGSEDTKITDLAGCGAHEIRTWIAALAATSVEGSYRADLLFYSPIQEWITGTAVMTARPAAER